MSAHRTVGRVTRILELVGQTPGMKLADLARALNAPKASIHGFLGGLIETGWLHVERHHYFLGPAIYAVSLLNNSAPGRLVTREDLEELHRTTGGRVLLGVPTGNSLMYVEEVGGRPLFYWWTRSGIRRPLPETAAGKVLLAFMPDRERMRLLNEHYADHKTVPKVLREVPAIRSSRIARNDMPDGNLAFAAPVFDRDGRVSATLTIVLQAPDAEKKARRTIKVLDKYARSLSVGGTTPT